jgi:hypothetical protein
MTQEKISAAQSNKVFFGLLDGGPAQIKQAADMVTDFTRVKIRESSFFEKLMPAIVIGNDELTPQLTNDKNVKLVEREPGSPAAITIPLGAQPVQYYIKGDRYPVYFDRIVTSKFTKDISELRSYGMDIRQVISDNAILDMDFEFDQKMLTAVQSIIGSEGSTVPETGVIQNLVIVDPAGITRSSLLEIKKILPQTFAHLEVATILLNNITINDIAKFGRDEVGGDLSQTMFEDGFQQKKLFGVNWVVTNKVELVAANEFYGFASPEFIGKSFVLEETTMFVDKRAYNLEFFAYCERGATIGNAASVCRARITATT